MSPRWAARRAAGRAAIITVLLTMATVALGVLPSGGSGSDGDELSALSPGTSDIVISTLSPVAAFAVIFALLFGYYRRVSPRATEAVAKSTM